MEIENVKIGQIVVIEYGITDPLKKQGEQGEIIKIDKKEETAFIKFKDKRVGEYVCNTFNIPDDLNPEYMFSMTANYLLSMIATGKLDAKELAINTLRSRGMDIKGKWIGFSK